MSPLAEVAALFLKLGFTAFGGPADVRGRSAEGSKSKFEK